MSPEKLANYADDQQVMRYVRDNATQIGRERLKHYLSNDDILIGFIRVCQTSQGLRLPWEALDERWFCDCIAALANSRQDELYRGRDLVDRALQQCRRRARETSGPR
jgi:hypothetical protein